MINCICRSFTVSLLLSTFVTFLVEIRYGDVIGLLFQSSEFFILGSDVICLTLIISMMSSKTFNFSNNWKIRVLLIFGIQLILVIIYLINSINTNTRDQIIIAFITSLVKICLTILFLETRHQTFKYDYKVLQILTILIVFLSSFSSNILLFNLQHVVFDLVSLINNILVLISIFLLYQITRNRIIAPIKSLIPHQIDLNDLKLNQHKATTSETIDYFCRSFVISLVLYSFFLFLINPVFKKIMLILLLSPIFISFWNGVFYLTIVILLIRFYDMGNNEYLGYMLTISIILITLILVDSSFLFPYFVHQMIDKFNIIRLFKTLYLIFCFKSVSHAFYSDKILLKFLAILFSLSLIFSNILSLIFYPPLDMLIGDSIKIAFKGAVLILLTQTILYVAEYQAIAKERLK